MELLWLLASFLSQSLTFLSNIHIIKSLIQMSLPPFGVPNRCSSVSLYGDFILLESLIFLSLKNMALFKISCHLKNTLLGFFFSSMYPIYIVLYLLT